MGRVRATLGMVLIGAAAGLWTNPDGLSELPTFLQTLEPGNQTTPDTPAAKPRKPKRVDGIPANYLRLYRSAAAGRWSCNRVDWALLAAIGKIESGHGVNMGPSRAGAKGPMQFMPRTWRAYGVDGDGDGTKDIWKPHDAIPAAARYLCASGASRNLRKAVWHYNHSWSYVDDVLGGARRLRAG